MLRGQVVVHQAGEVGVEPDKTWAKEQRITVSNGAVTVAAAD